MKEKNNLFKLIGIIVSIVAFLAAAASVVYIFREKITSFIEGLGFINKNKLSEYDDFIFDEQAKNYDSGWVKE